MGRVGQTSPVRPISMSNKLQTLIVRTYRSAPGPSRILSRIPNYLTYKEIVSIVGRPEQDQNIWQPLWLVQVRVPETRSSMPQNEVIHHWLTVCNKPMMYDFIRPRPRPLCIAKLPCTLHFGTKYSRREMPDGKKNQSIKSVFMTKLLLSSLKLLTNLFSLKIWKWWH